MTTEILGKAGDTCRDCGAPLAADQRYCLNCGRRRGETRVDFRRHVPDAGASANGRAQADALQSAAAQPPLDPSAQAPQAAGPQRDYTPLAAVAGIAVLGVMLLIGVLIGKGDGSGSTTPPPVVVRGGEAEGGAGANAAAKGEEGAAKPEKAKIKGKGKAAGGKDLATGKQGGAGPVEASDEALQELQEQSPDEYSKNSAKLPDEIATPGAAPPKDNKTPGGGSAGTAIE